MLHLLVDWEYPHWMMMAGAILVALGFMGFAFHQNRNGPVNEPSRARESTPTERLRPCGKPHPHRLTAAEGEGEIALHGRKPQQPVDTTGGCLLRRMAEASVRPEIIAIKLNRTVHAVKARAYMIGLPLKWFKLKAKGK